MSLSLSLFLSSFAFSSIEIFICEKYISFVEIVIFDNLISYVHRMSNEDTRRLEKEMNS